MDVNIPVTLDGGNPAVQENPDGSANIALGGIFTGMPDDKVIPHDLPHNANLAEYLDTEDLSDTARICMDGFTEDFQSTEEQRKFLVQGLRLLGLSEDTTSIFEGVNAVSHPMLLRIVTGAQNKALAEMFPSGGPVRTKINAENITEALELKAKKVRCHMNWQLTEQMEEYEEELDRMLFYMFFNGSAFKKAFFDETIGRQRSEYLTVDDFIVNNNFSSLEDADRYTQIHRISQNELLKRQLAGIYLDVELVMTEANKDSFKVEFSKDVQKVEVITGASEHKILECHIDLDLPGFEHKAPDSETGDLEPSGLCLPYIVYLHADSRQILGIYRNYKQDDKTFKRRAMFVHYYFLPGPGFLGLGYLHLIGGLTEAANASLRHLITAGAFANFPGGFVAKNAKITGGQGLMKLGEWRRIETYGTKISEVFQQIPVKDASPILYELHKYLVDLANQYAGTAEELVQKAATYGPVGTILALLEQAESPYATVHKRLHRSQAKELRILAEINYETLPEPPEYVTYGVYDGQISRADYDGVAIMPVSNPNIPTASHRLTSARSQLEIGMQAPQFYNLYQLHRNVQTVIDPDRVDQIMVPPQQAQPLDPIGEVQAVLANQPTKAFQGQDHDAHISFIASFIQDPRYGGALEDPQIQALKALLQDHIGWRLRMEVQLVLGKPMPPQGQPIPPQMDMAIAQAQAIALAALGKASGPSEADQANMDNIIEQQKLALKNKEIDTKKQINDENLSFKEKELSLETAVSMAELEQKNSLTKKK